MSKNISSFFILQGTIDEEDREVYEYSFEVFFSTILSFATLFVIALISRKMIYTSFFLVGFIPIRLVAGGFHAKNHFRCFLILVVVYSIFLLSLAIVPIKSMITIILLCISVSILLVFILAPSKDKNKHVSQEKTTHLKKRSRIMIIIYFALIALLVVFIPDIKISFSITMGTFSVSISLLANYIKNGSNNTNRKEVIHNEEI
jgi:accessory gene regulator B